MFSVVQIILLLIVWVVVTLASSWMILLPYGTNVLLGWLVGLVLGDPVTGLVVGGTMELMGIGMNPLGGSVVPDYATGTFVGAAFAIGTGQGLEVGTAIGIPVATLCVELTVAIRLINSFFLHRSMAASEKGNFKAMQYWAWGGLLPQIVIGTLPIFLVLTLGSGVVESIVNAIPEWLNNGFTAASGVLPAVGLAILLICLPLKNNFMWVILGYLLYAYLGMPVLGVAILAFVIAWVVYINNSKPQAATVSTTSSEGGIEDDE